MKTTVIPVIHFQDEAQAIRNAELVFAEGCDHVFLIDMTGPSKRARNCAGVIKTIYPDKKVGMNFLGVESYTAVEIGIRAGLDMTWTDHQLTHTKWAKDDDIKLTLNRMTQQPNHMLFVGCAFKYQPEEPCPGDAARYAVDCGFIPTTSGDGTGIEADVEKIALIRENLQPTDPLAIASGITPDNASRYTPYLSHILVATGISVDDYNFDPVKVRDLVAICHG